MNISAQVTPQVTRVGLARERIAIQRLGGAKPAPVGHSAIKPALMRALSTGGATRPRALTINWDVAGTGKYRCLDPVPRTIEARQGHDDVVIFGHKPRPRSWLDLKMRCRKCVSCLQLRALDWSNRAQIECAKAGRTWFGTMTLTPYMQLQAEHHARFEVGQQGGDFDMLTEDEKFSEKHRVISRWITLWVKRVRKTAKGPIRLMVVCERHKSGLPHYHCLIHEDEVQVEGRYVSFATSERQLRLQWDLGFSKFVLVDDTGQGKAAWYVCKYLNKSTSARVRASVDYGALDRTVTARSTRIAPQRSQQSEAQVLNAVQNPVTA